MERDRAVRVRERLRATPWGLFQARALADELHSDGRGVRALVGELFGDDVETRKRAADVARRITDHDPRPLARYAEELAGLLDATAPGESRTRWHLGLVVPRLATTPGQRMRAARTMMLLAGDESNAVRCSAVEGLARLALDDASLREEAEVMVRRFLLHGTKAMKSRARAAERALRRRYGED